MYKKVCKYCGKEFSSEARNTRYCSQECCDKAQVKRIAHNKTKKRKRKLYEENREINVTLTTAYRLAHRIADLYHIPKKCACCGGSISFKGLESLTEEDKNTPCEGPLELHHRNINPFDNSLGNLVYLCKKHHSLLHAHIGNVNMVEVLNEAEDYAGFEEEEDKHIKMIEYFNKKLEAVFTEGE